MGICLLLQKWTSLNQPSDSENDSPEEAFKRRHSQFTPIETHCMSSETETELEQLRNFICNVDNKGNTCWHYVADLRVEEMKNRVWNNYPSNWKTGPKFFRMAR